MNDAAIHHGRIKPARMQQGCDHSRGGGLAMGAGHSHIRLEPHQFRQHFRPPHHRQASLARLIQFRIPRLDRCGDHNHLSTRQVLCSLFQKHLGAQTFKPPRDLRGF